MFSSREEPSTHTENKGRNKRETYDLELISKQKFIRRNKKHQKVLYAGIDPRTFDRLIQWLYCLGQHRLVTQNWSEVTLVGDFLFQSMLEKGSVSQ